MKENILHQWYGHGRLRPLKNDVFTIGRFFDPYYTPNENKLNEFENFGINYLDAIDKMIKRQ